MTNIFVHRALSRIRRTRAKHQCAIVLNYETRWKLLFVKLTKSDQSHKLNDIEKILTRFKFGGLVKIRQFAIFSSLPIFVLIEINKNLKI